MADYSYDNTPPRIPNMTLVRWDAHDEWSALYVDDRLSIVGDHYLIDERIHRLARVETLNADFLMGGQTANDAPHLLKTVKDYHNGTVVAREKAARLRAEAAKLLVEAGKLEHGG